MPHPCLLELTSRSEGTLKGSDTLYGKSGAIIVYGVDHSVGLTVGRVDGPEPLDRLTHDPLTVFKEVDAVSPVLYQHLNACTLLDKVVLRYYITDTGGRDVNFYSVILTNAIVTRIEQVTNPAFIQKNEPYRPMESVSFSYKNIRWVDEVNSKETSGSAFLLHDYGDEKKLLAQGSLSAPIAPIGAFALNQSRTGAVSKGSPIKTGVFDAKTGKAVPLKIKSPTSPGAGAAISKTESAMASSTATDRFAATRGVSPTSLADARNRLARVRKDISANGYTPKYTDAQLADLAKYGNVGGERFQVRFMEESYLNHPKTPTVPLSGTMGMVMEGATGKGAKYWSTSFDQIEDADTDPRLLCHKLGLDYNPEKKYVLIITDTQKAIPLTGVKSVPATFEKVGEFANTELPKKFPKSFTDVAMTPEFQATYAEHYELAVKEKFLPYRGAKDVKKFGKYLHENNLGRTDQILLKKRMLMHEKIGNTQDYIGNGLTKDMIRNSPNQYGVVETLNFERKEINLQSLMDDKAITIIKGLKII